MGARPGDEPPITLNRLWHQMTRRHMEDEGRWLPGWVGRPTWVGRTRPRSKLAQSSLGGCHVGLKVPGT